MNQSKQIIQSFDNVQRIYQQVATLLKITEETIVNEKFDNSSFPAEKGTKCTWESSASMNVPERWFQKFFVRHYTEKGNKQTKRAIGIGIWLYGEAETEMVTGKPYLSCSVIEFPKGMENNLSEWVRKAGRNENYAFEPIADSLLYMSELTKDDVETVKEFDTMRVFFIDLIKITDDDQIKKLIIDPLKAIMSGNNQVIKANDAYLSIGEFESAN